MTRSCFTHTHNKPLFLYLFYFFSIRAPVRAAVCCFCVLLAHQFSFYFFHWYLYFCVTNKVDLIWFETVLCCFISVVDWFKHARVVLADFWDQCAMLSVCVQVGGRLKWQRAGLTVNTTNSTLYEQFIEHLRPRTGYAVRVSVVYRSLLRSVWPSSIQHTFFTSGTVLSGLLKVMRKRFL